MDRVIADLEQQRSELKNLLGGWDNLIASDERRVAEAEASLASSIEARSRVQADLAQIEAAIACLARQREPVAPVLDCGRQFQEPVIQMAQVPQEITCHPRRGRPRKPSSGNTELDRIRALGRARQERYRKRMAK